MADTLQDLGAHIAAKLGPMVTGTTFAFGELTIHANAADILTVLAFLRNDPECDFRWFIDISGADYPERPQRFDVVYHLLAPHKNRRVRVKIATDEDTPVPSAVSLFAGANWYEREVFDLYGVLFAGHPDLRRILTDYGFSGHPLRKDFPLTGLVEVAFDDEAKRVTYQPVKLVQEFRTFDYLSPWEGTDYVLPGDEKAKQ
jgi:NADH-quinone oxidoreductase subunit C